MGVRKVVIPPPHEVDAIVGESENSVAGGWIVAKLDLSYFLFLNVALTSGFVLKVMRHIATL